MKFIVVVPVAVLALAFAIVNRQEVSVSFDPFSSADTALQVTAPLFILLLLALGIGVVVGSAATWFAQGRARRAARLARAEADRLRAEAARLRVKTAPPAGTNLPVPRQAAYEG
jgi:uncharacterized integral membrane protein